MMVVLPPLVFCSIDLHILCCPTLFLCEEETDRVRKWQIQSQREGRQNTKSGSVPNVSYIACRGVGEIDESHVPEVLPSAC